ncbi:M23 family metallopeptidase [Candidatus Peregrinibacteria bacterium]|nr:M23 family metallopeptidase [Candidatus Peregrinibacteria bacterium]
MKKIPLLCLFSAVLWGCAPIPPVEDLKSKPAQETQTPAASEPLISADWPLAGAEKRVTKKPFGLKVSPADSPVQPEKFSGYHTGVDYETFADEKDTDVFVSAVCEGTILQKRKAQGYGGVVVQSCQFGDQPVTVVYGHLQLSSITLTIGESLKAGERFATLGRGFSTDTGGERKHLHLGIKKGAVANLLGYVQKESTLQGWMDFEHIRKTASPQ